ncbi:MAG: SAM-dependent methyltransferase [Ignavibacteria bacterium]|nr:SAM-dependent methyltransferase [Ignavibacteria bacterium]
MKIELVPIAYVKNSRTEISDDFWGSITSEITLTDDFSEKALKGIEDFSHLEIVFYFDRLDNSKIEKGTRHPRGNTNWPDTGVFVQRGKNRPNKLGLTVCELIKKEGKTLFVKNLDAIDGTPVLDIKPVIKEYLPEGEIRQPAWTVELMKDYWKP